MFTGKAVAKRVDHLPVIFLSNPEQRCNRQRHALCIQERRQIHVPSAIRERLENPFCELDSESSLATAADAGQCEQSRLLEQCGVLLEIVVVTNETGQLRRQVVARRIRAWRTGYIGQR